MNTDNRFDKDLYTMTTIVYSKVYIGDEVYSFQGSAFYYVEVVPKGPKKDGGQWCRLDKYWLVSNRHIFLPEISGVEHIPDEIEFGLRKIEGDLIVWESLHLNKEEIKDLLKLHKYENVDVAVIDVTSLIHSYTHQLIEKKIPNNILFPTTLTNLNMPEHSPVTIDVATDIIVASYPKGFYDDVNKFPIVKSGIIASAWGTHFKGDPLFQIDAQLFPGSSGGLVLSKPNDIAVINGSVKYRKKKEYVLLGVYSGEYTWDRTIEIAGEKHTIETSYGLGNVWYSYLITEIIKDGMKL